ncbi:MAG: hypothetical protein KBB09_00070 [Firmicutes bacterium]|nr:hypothetical protein [Bacillota bacterium]
MNPRVRMNPALLGATIALVLVLALPAVTHAAGAVIKLTDRLGTSQSVDLLSLPQLDYKASYKRSTGAIVGPFSYRGPSLLSVLALMGGMNENDAVQLISEDGYRMSLTYGQVHGEVTVYDGKGEAMEDFERPILILAVSSDSPAFEQEGVRAVFAGPKAPLTDGHTWVKWIVEVKVIPMVKEWELELEGVVKAKMDRSTFESLATCPLSPHPGADWGATDGTYAGVPLWTLVSVVDNVEPENSHYTYDRALAASGYTVRVTSKDGTYVDFDSKDLIFESGVFVAFTKDGKLIGEEDGPLVLTGPRSPRTLRNVVSIKLIGVK